MKIKMFFISAILAITSFSVSASVTVSPKGVGFTSNPIGSSWGIGVGGVPVVNFGHGWGIHSSFKPVGVDFGHGWGIGAGGVKIVNFGHGWGLRPVQQPTHQFVGPNGIAVVECILKNNIMGLVEGVENCEKAGGKTAKKK